MSRKFQNRARLDDTALVDSYHGMRGFDSNHNCLGQVIISLRIKDATLRCNTCISMVACARTQLVKLNVVCHRKTHTARDTAHQPSMRAPLMPRNYRLVAGDVVAAASEDGTLLVRDTTRACTRPIHATSDTASTCSHRTEWSMRS